MNIKIGEKIKKLRKKADVTQDKFAEYLGITPQAISRWENGSAYPDIEIIPAIANFFSVPTDELFGVDQAKNQEKIEKIYEKVREYSPKGLFDKQIEILRKAVQEFPNNHGLLGALAFALSHKKEHTDEAIAIWERVAEDTDDEHEKYSTLLHLAYTYNNTGDKNKAVATAHKLPGVSCTSSIVLSRILEGEERFKQIKGNITEFSDWLYQEYSMLARSKYAGQPDKQILLYNKAVAVFEILCENKDYGFYNERLSDLYNSLCYAYLELKDYANALEALSKAASHAIAFDAPEAFENNTHFEHSSIVFEREPSDSNNAWFTGGASHNNSHGILQDLKDARFDAIRNDAKFAQIIAELEKYAKTYE